MGLSMMVAELFCIPTCTYAGQATTVTDLRHTYYDRLTIYIFNVIIIYYDISTRVTMCTYIKTIIISERGAVSL